MRVIARDEKKNVKIPLGHTCLILGLKFYYTFGIILFYLIPSRR